MECKINFLETSFSAVSNKLSPFSICVVFQALSVPGSPGQGKVVGTRSRRVDMIISVSI